MTRHSFPTQTGEPILFGETPLHGMYYAPEATPDTAVLVVPPLFEEKRCAHRAVTAAARALATAGVAVLHPDLYGTGNSRGDLTAVTLDRWHNDLHEAANELRTRSGVKRVTLLACRTGALLAVPAFMADEATSRHILWHPVVTSKTYLHQLRTRRMIQTQVSGNTALTDEQDDIDGQRVSPALRQDFAALRLPDTPPSAPVSLLQCSFNDRMLAEYAVLATRWGEHHLRISTFICQPFWLPHTPSDYTALAQTVVREVLS